MSKKNANSEVQRLEKELADARERAARDAEKQNTKRTELANSLPAEFGFDNITEVVKFLRKLGHVKSKRSKVTPEIDGQIREMVVAGKTGAEIASTLKLSTATIQNRKKVMGLVAVRS